MWWCGSITFGVCSCVLRGEICWIAVRSERRGMLDCSMFCVERYAGLQYVLSGEVCWTAVRSVWRGMLDCSTFCVERYAGLQYVLCGELCWTAVRSVWRGTPDCNPTYLSTQNARTHSKCYAAASPHLIFYILNKFLNSVTLTSNIQAPWRWSE
jgi:hypothetical protein